MPTPTSSAIRYANPYRGYAAAVLVCLLFGLAPASPLCSQSVTRRSSSPYLANQLELQMCELINRAPALQWDDRLAAAARMHSQEMARNGFFSHDGADGSSPADRVSAAGIKWLSTGENIAYCKGVGEAESLFMNEPKFEHNHRWNILNAKYTHVGVGIVRAADGSLYITQEL